jgi:hypothetical protein
LPQLANSDNCRTVIAAVVAAVVSKTLRRRASTLSGTARRVEPGALADNFATKATHLSERLTRSWPAYL